MVPPIRRRTTRSRSTRETTPIRSPGSSLLISGIPRGHQGRKISGDDIFLINAVQKDQTSAAFNSLNYIFDLETRKLKSDVACFLGYKTRPTRSTPRRRMPTKRFNLQRTNRYCLIPVEHIDSFTRTRMPRQKEFLHWVLSEGQKFNHAWLPSNRGGDSIRELKEISEPHYTEKF